MLAGLLAPFVAAGSAVSADPGKVVRKTFDFGGTERSYFVYEAHCCPSSTRPRHPPNANYRTIPAEVNKRAWELFTGTVPIYSRPHPNK